MSEFLDYKVELTLSDGVKYIGIITHVDSRQITLSNVIKSTSPQELLAVFQVESSQIKDLKVIQLPQNLRTQLGKSSKKKGTNTRQNGASILDDAIVFAQAATPPLASVLIPPVSSNYGTPRNSSRTNTPQLSSVRANYQSSIASGGDTDWNNEVQEIKSSNEFDFAANLAMFDKKSVFADFQKKDTVNPNDRLVGHNKLDKVQKPRKEKYDNDEMVLEVNKADNWDNIGNTNKKVPKPLKNSSATASSKVSKDLSSSTQNLKLVLADNLSPIPLSSPVQLLEIERLSAESYGISAPIMAEICANNLAKLITSSILGGSTRLSNKKNHNLPPLVLLLIGSARCGSRAFVTGRHLTNHGVRVLAFVINTDDTDKELSTQWNLFEKSGGKVISSNVDDLLNIINHQLDTPVELIIDALQGYDDHLEDIFYQEADQKALRTIMKWCNEPQQQSKIMSLDIPSGIDGGSGTLLDESLKLNCKWCISMGLPITGLIHAYKNGHLETGDVLHYLIDVGIPNKVYSSKGNLRKFDKFWYSAESCIKLELSND
jgi:enhancer of mRNA-decapping protein 3